MKKDLLADIRSGRELSFRQQVFLILQLSIPAIFAQVSSIVMQYIDAAMVGRLGKECSAAIGLISSSTWLIGGITMSISAGFTVQVAHFIGAEKEKEARNVVKQGLLVAMVVSLILLALACSISGWLPAWLGGEEAILHDASMYFLVYALSIPIYQLNGLASGAIQCSGNMKLPSILHIVMCFLDVIFNFYFIFPSRMITIFGNEIVLPGAGLGVIGAALGTSVAELVIALVMLYYLLVRSEALHLRKGEQFSLRKEDLKKALTIGIPVGIEQIVMCSAYIVSTKIVAPLGSVALAAHSFAVTAESLCYMPGYGIGSAATSVIGQSIGAGRGKLAKRLGWLTIVLGASMMALTGMLMYGIAPFMMGLLTPVEEIKMLGVAALRVELWAEPLYGASIVATGVFRGAGDTKIACILNFCSMWLVRIPLAWFLASRMGLTGVWLAMCIELCVRGILYLLRYVRAEFGIEKRE